MGTIHVLCEDGDISINWDPENEDSVKNAKTEFARLKTDGYELYAPGEEGQRGKRMQRFSKKTGTVIAAPGVQKPEDRTAGTRTRAMAGGPVAAFDE